MAEYFEPGFKQTLQNVKVDVATRWPILRDEKQPQKVIYDVIVQISESDEGDDLPYCLDLYSKCLTYIRQYDAKAQRGTPQLHRPSIIQALKDHAPVILKHVWEELFVYPFFVDNVSLQSSAMEFVAKLFEFNDCWEDVDGASNPIILLWDLYIYSPVVRIVDHCFFTTGDRAVRQRSWEVRRLVREYDHLDVHPPEEYYKLLGVGAVRARFDYLLSSDPSYGALLDLLQDIQSDAVGSCIDHSTWDKVLNKSIALIDDAVTLLDDSTSDRKEKDIDNLWECISCVHSVIELVAKYRSVPLRAVLKDVLQTRSGAEVVASAFVASAEKSPNRSISLLIADGRYDRLRFGVYFLPFLMQEAEEMENWTASDFNSLARLTRVNVKVWKPTFDSLSLLEKGPELHKKDTIPAFMRLWARYGSVLGIQNLVEPILGCCNAECSSFLRQTESEISQCFLCEKIWYCNEDCQEKDRKFHRHYCVKGRATYVAV